ncbi:phospholipase A-2-activating protein [Nematocida displodere]|uniref:Phospholipase A-2-activating protein n=1 Tax=Nematocida displodere TaxID=1805483 RepID=A0A177EAW5_9MICR|nr:phospholipase A-2-activating protein [Nematocida displodere]
MVEIEFIKKLQEADVKDCAVYGECLVSVGRDKKLRIHQLSDLTEIYVSEDLGCFVNSVLCLGECIYTGLQDGRVVVWSVGMEKTEEGVKAHVMQVKTLNHHKSNVCSLRAFENTVVSASWDGVICIITEKSVEVVTIDKGLWVAEILPNGRETLVAGCTDGRLVYFEREGKRYEVSKGLAIHKMCIRDMLVEKDRIITLSNTGCVIICDFSGRVIKTVDLDSISFRIRAWEKYAQYVVSSDEGSVRVLSQALEIDCTLGVPVLSCWNSLPHEERVYVCGSDGRVFVFGGSPRAEAREELQGLQEAYLTELARKKAESETPATASPGSPNYKVVKGIVYEKKGDTWEIFGDVIKEEKKDHTIDITLAEKTFTLSFNKTDAYEEVAKDFVEKHSISTEYISEIVEFLDKNFKQQKKKDVSQFTVYGNISVEGVKKKIEGLGESATVIKAIEDLEKQVLTLSSPCFKETSSNLEAILSEWVAESKEKFPILDCYKYFIAKGMEFDFMFLKGLQVLGNSKDAFMYVKLATNLLAYAPDNRKYFATTVSKILDKNLVNEETIRNYKKNLHLLE